MTSDDTILRRDAAENRSRLISAAIDVFNEVGVEAGVEQIASRAGVGIGTLYRRFPTKDALIEFLVNQMLDEMTRAAVDAQWISDGRGLEQFLYALADQFAANRGCLQRLWSYVTADPSTVDGLVAQIDRLYADARDHRALRAEVARRDVRVLIWAMQGVIANTDGDAQDDCRQLVAMLFAGLTPRS